jgi:hypothetical protein
MFPPPCLPATPPFQTLSLLAAVRDCALRLHSASGLLPSPPALAACLPLLVLYDAALPLREMQGAEALTYASGRSTSSASLPRLQCLAAQLRAELAGAAGGGQSVLLRCLVKGPATCMDFTYADAGSKEPSAEFFRGLADGWRAGLLVDGQQEGSGGLCTEVLQAEGSLPEALALAALAQQLAAPLSEDVDLARQCGWAVLCKAQGGFVVQGAPAGGAQSV